LNVRFLIPASIIKTGCAGIRNDTDAFVTARAERISKLTQNGIAGNIKIIYI
jgi:hypothetical protein